eukprot:EG_transcript_22163
MHGAYPPLVDEGIFPSTPLLCIVRRTLWTHSGGSIRPPLPASFMRLSPFPRSPQLKHSHWTAAQSGKMILFVLDKALPHRELSPTAIAVAVDTPLPSQQWRLPSSNHRSECIDPPARPPLLSDSAAWPQCVCYVLSQKVVAVICCLASHPAAPQHVVCALARCDSTAGFCVGLSALCS